MPTSDRDDLKTATTLMQEDGAHEVTSNSRAAGRGLLGRARRLIASASRATVENLEQRKLLSSAYYQDGGITVEGNTYSANNIEVAVYGHSVKVDHNGAEKWFNVSSVNKIKIKGGNLADRLTIKDSVNLPSKIYGYDGNDTLTGGSGHDKIDGGNGTDTGRNGEEYISVENTDGNGGGGNGGGGGGGGNNGGTISYENGAVALRGLSSGTNNYTAKQYGNSVRVSVNDKVGWYDTSSISGIKVYGGSGTDRFEADSNVYEPVTFYGYGGNDYAKGGSANDTLDGGDGTDSLHGGNGTDTGYSGEVTTSIENNNGGGGGGGGGNGGGGGGGGGNSGGTIYYANGKVVIEGDSSNANVAELAGTSSSIRAKLNGTEKWFGKSSINGIVFKGGSGNDKLTVTNSSVTEPVAAYGYGGNDLLTGGNANDTLDGGDGTDTLHGGAGTDTGISGEVTTSIENGGNGGGGGGGGDNGGGGNGGGGGGDDGAVKPVARITATSSLSIKAGQAVQVHALNSTLNRGDWDSSYVEWDFGDTGGRYNQLVGFNAAHLYERPGTYTIKLKVYNEDRGVDTETVTVNVSSDNRQIFYVSQYGSDSNSGTSSSAPLKTIQKAVDRVKAHGDHAKILLKRGERHDLANRVAIERNDVIIGAYGSGNAPAVRWTRHRYDIKSFFYQSDYVEGLVVRDLLMYTDHNGDNDSNGMPHAVQPGGKNTTVVDNVFRDVGDAVAGNAVPEGVLVMDNRANGNNDIRRYFGWLEGSGWTILGNYAPNSTREHTIRLGNATKINLGYNDFGNKDLRSQGDQWDYAKAALNIQKGSFAYVHHNKVRGPWGVGPLGNGDGLGDTGARFKYAIFEGNESFGSQYNIDHGAEHVTVRSNIFHQDSAIAIRVEAYDYSYNRGTRDINIVNNTIINHDSTGRAIVVGNKQSELTIANNLYVAPNLYTGPYLTSILWVESSNLNGFSEISNNVWADADASNYADGIMYVGTGTDASGYRDAGEWNALPQVHSDRFSDVHIDGSFKPSNASTVNVGKAEETVFVDFYGKWTSNNAGRTVGAVTL